MQLKTKNFKKKSKKKVKTKQILEMKNKNKHLKLTQQHKRLKRKMSKHNFKMINNWRSLKEKSQVTS